jgi:hypothetical protein
MTALEDLDEVFEVPTVDLISALVARAGVTVTETDAATIITVPRLYPPVMAHQEEPTE